MADSAGSRAPAGPQSFACRVILLRKSVAQCFLNQKMAGVLRRHLHGIICDEGAAECAEHRLC